MAAKKREIYARAAVQLRTHERPAEAERLCPGSMGLYLYLLVQARGEGTNGDVSETVAFASWGAPIAYRRKQAEALIAVGLLVRDGTRLHVVKYDEHNDTSADIASNREADRIRKENSRRSVTCPPSVTRDIDRTATVGHSDFPISISISEEAGDQDPDRIASDEVTEIRTRPDPSELPPDWWADALETIRMRCGETIPPGPAWLRYAGHRAGKRLPATRSDALYWLTGVIVKELKDERVKTLERADQRAKWDKQRAGPNTLAEVKPINPEAKAKADAVFAAAIEKRRLEREQKAAGK
jgi:hypothetical protein